MKKNIFKKIISKKIISKKIPVSKQIPEKSLKIPPKKNPKLYQKPYKNAGFNVVLARDVLM